MPEIGRSTLTDEQHCLLRTAVKRGYFAVPRETTLTEIAVEHDLAGQEASEQLRGGLDTVVREYIECHA